MTATATPKPQIPVSGLSQHAAEMRRRITVDLLREGEGVITTTFDLLTVAAWIESQEPFYEEVRKS